MLMSLVKILAVLVFGAICVLAGAMFAHLRANKVRYALAETVAPMSVEIALKKEHTCSKLSPPIKIGGVPADARHILVEITDLNNQYLHGGGLVVPPPGGEISEGALSEYGGPCPDGQHIYRFHINALDDKRKIVGIGEVTKICCEWSSDGTN